ncbi:MAG: GT2 family glycosyltransferase [Planctomycetota bacterium]|jgi:GT2 family glycosyltransferase
MTRPVSIVIPCLDDRDLLKSNLPALLAELEVRDEKDEVIIVDDTGEQVLANWVKAEFPSCRVVSQKKNLGFARALLAGIKTATYDLVFCMNPDVRVRKGFLGPLVACMADEDIFAVAPRVLLDGTDRVESITELKVNGGFVEIIQPGLRAEQEQQSALPRPIVFAVGGTCLISKSAFLEMGGMDPMYEPFYLEDLDICFRAWLKGQRVLYQPASVVEHHHRGTIGKIVEPEFVRAMIEKNRLLFQWTFLDEPVLLQEHVGALYRMATDAWLSDSRDELIWILLALDQLKAVLKARKATGKPALGFTDVLKASTAS